MNRDAYGAFAYAYDAALGRRFFEAIRRRLVPALVEYAPKPGTHLDLACGTGLVLEFMRQRGWQSVGIDASLPMLRLARRRHPGAIAGDLRALPVRRTFDCVTCLYDSLNHLRSRNDLVAAFRAMRDVMGNRSVLIFDINHAAVYPEIWGMREPFVASGRDFHLEIATTFRAKDALGRALVRGWAVLPDGERVEIREVHQQRAWEEREILEALDRAGLVAQEVGGFDPFRDGEERGPVKLLFVCRRAEERSGRKG
jgi:SAM-dependent methyltransferase